MKAYKLISGSFMITMAAMTLPAQTFNVIHTFTPTTASITNVDGANPCGVLVLSGNTLYGTAIQGGARSGTVFALNTNGSVFTVLHAFTYITLTAHTNVDGALPYGGLALSGNKLYGTATSGGTNGSGTVFSISTDGSAFTVLHTFMAISNNTNLDGANPYAGLVLSGNTLYGTATRGGVYGGGTVFSLNTNGSNFKVLRAFDLTPDGAYPSASLVLAGNTLYGTASGGGVNIYFGTVFSLNTDGSNFTVLYAFTGLSDGSTPVSSLVIRGDTLYGTTEIGSKVFSVKTNGAAFTIVHSLGDDEGANPRAGLTLANNTFFGTAENGAWNGTVFSLSLPQLTIMRSDSNIILTWPTNSMGLILQSTVSLVPPSGWTVVAPEPVIVNGQNTVTNSISGTQQFYRLSQ